MTTSDEQDPLPPLAPANGPPRAGVASSVASAKAGQLLYVGRGGQVLSARRVRASYGLAYAMLGGSVVLLGAVYGSLLSPLAGLAAVGAFGALFCLQWRHVPRFRKAIALSAACRWEDAHALLSRVKPRGLPRAMRGQLPLSLAGMEVFLGHPEACLSRLEASGLLDEKARSGNAAVRRIFALSLQTSVLARLRRLDEARAAREKLREAIANQSRRHPRVEGDLFALLLQSSELVVAFEADAPRELPDDQGLHLWAREALARSRFGEMLFSLSWAFVRRGDEDMAQHLMREAPARIERWSLPVTHPRLSAWVASQRQAWGMPPLDFTRAPQSED